MAHIMMVKKSNSNDKLVKPSAMKVNPRRVVGAGCTLHINEKFSGRKTDFSTAY